MDVAVIQSSLQRGITLHRAGQFQQAESIYRQILAKNPDQPDALHLLGLIALHFKHNDAALDLIARAAVLQPRCPEFQQSLASALVACNRIADAMEAYRRLIALQPHSALPHNEIGNVYFDRRAFTEALACYERAIALEPDNAIYRNNIGNTLKELTRYADAIPHLRKAIALRPDLTDAHFHLGSCLSALGQSKEAEDSLRTAIQLRPAFAEAYSELTNILRDKGRLTDALACIRRSIEINPNLAKSQGKLILLLNCDPSATPSTLGDEAKRWAARHADPFTSGICPHQNDRTSDRRLRIGYVSADFYDHACALYLHPLLRHHDRERFEIFCYANVRKPDQITESFRQLPFIWRDIQSLSDDQIAEQIRADRIDILIDLKLHTEDNNLLVFARKPAPVQVTWLGYPGTTGLSTIDYRLSDPYLDPPDADTSVYSEQTIRLPETFWCYNPLCDEIPIGPLQAEQAGHITFGCLNHLTKLSDEALALFAQVVAAVPNSRLILRVDNEDARKRFVDVMTAAAPVADRVEFIASMPRGEYLKTYNRIDIALDPFPYNGHTTSLDAMWMGVPLVTLIGPTVVGRAGVSQLSNLDLKESIAESTDRYRTIATQLANDLPRLAGLRATLRERLKKSPLMDAPRFARNIEAAYRQMWHKWCEREMG